MLEDLLKFAQRPKKSAVSIYIGPESIEIVQAKRNAKGPVIVKSIYKEILKKEFSASTIKGIFLSEGIQETAVTTTVPEESLMLRRFSMPIIPPKERQNAVRFEAKRHIPFNIEEVISSYYIIKEDRDKNKMDILFAAVKKNEINSIIELLNQAGLEIERIEPVSLALIKSLILGGNLDESSPPTAILHFFTDTRAQMIITANGIPYIKREVSLIGREGGIEEQIQTELRLSASYYKREFPDKNISKLIVCGLKEVPSWLNTIKSALGMPVEQATPLKSLTGAGLPAPQLEIGIGLAYRMLEKPRVSLNLLPKEFAPAKYNIQKIAGVEIIAGIIIFVLVFFSGIPSSFMLKRKISAADRAKTACPELNLPGKSIHDLKNMKTSWGHRKTVLASLTKERIIWNQKLTEIAKIIPGEIWINQLDFRDYIGTTGDRSLTMSCITYTKSPIKEIELANSFFQTLKKDSVFMKGFKKIDLGKITKTKIEEYTVINYDISAE